MTVLMLRVFTLCFTLAFLAGCGFAPGSHDEVARLQSPSGHADTVVVETNGGATTSFGYEIFVVPAHTATSRGTRVAALYSAVRSESAYGVNLRWRSADALEIEYLRAKQATLERPNTKVEGNAINVALRPGIEDPTAPAGGMLYNLELQRKRR